jgi:hypothetical protein
MLHAHDANGGGLAAWLHGMHECHCGSIRAAQAIKPFIVTSNALAQIFTILAPAQFISL